VQATHYLLPLNPFHLDSAAVLIFSFGTCLCVGEEIDYEIKPSFDISFFVK
jgi:hypothetical protein